jgi:hypothetical protein
MNMTFESLPSSIRAGVSFERTGVGVTPYEW